MREETAGTGDPAPAGGLLSLLVALGTVLLSPLRLLAVLLAVALTLLALLALGVLRMLALLALLRLALLRLVLSGFIRHVTIPLL